MTKSAAWRRRRYACSRKPRTDEKIMVPTRASEIDVTMVISHVSLLSLMSGTLKTGKPPATVLEALASLKAATAELMGKGYEQGGPWWRKKVKEISERHSGLRKAAAKDIAGGGKEKGPRRRSTVRSGRRSVFTKLKVK